ncbi:MAG: Crp/Fnr family transcriptional regulator [Candidatus Levybacteria bacterium]|nr:Crp/Fnr family transcriptional regulator [Candidatus Levybacteria bacterium]
MDFLASQKLEKFFVQFQTLHYKKHENILRSDETPRGVFYLKKGYVRDYTISKDGEELTLIIFKPGDIFPLRWALNNQIPNHYFEASTNVEIFRAPKDKFTEFIKSNPDVLYVLTQKISVRLGGLLERMEYMVFGDAYVRVCSILVILWQRFGEADSIKIDGKKKDVKFIKVPLTHKDVANLLGVTRETVSIEIEKLKKKGIVDHKSHIFFIKNLRKLEKESML